MSTKKNAASNRMWKMAGEELHAAPLSKKEQAQITEAFWLTESTRNTFFNGLRLISRAAAKQSQSAAQAVAAFLCERYAGQYDRKAVVKAVAISSAVLVPFEELLDDRQDHLLGAALWLLDYLKAHCPCKRDYLSLLPDLDESLECYIPFAADLDHPTDVIVRTMTVLQARKKKQEKAFASLLALIDDKTKAHLRQLFVASFLDYMDRTMKANSRLQVPEHESLCSGENTLQEQAILSASFSQPAPVEEYMALVMGPQLICRPGAEIQKELQSKKASDLLSAYCTDDPYALCAAYLLLEYEQDALASLGSLTAAVISCADNHLPWTRGDAPISRADFFDSTMPDYALRYEHQAYHEDDEPLISTQLACEEQLFFNATCVVMPRHKRPSQRLVQYFTENGVDEQRARELAWGALFACYSNAGGYIWEDAANAADAKSTMEDNQQEPPQDAHLLEKQSAEIESLTQEIKKLRGALHDAEQAARTMKNEVHAAEQKGEADRLELVQLRETLYCLRSGEMPETDSSSPLVELPWQVKRRVVVFGGHDSWRNTVKSLLPGVRLYDREVLPDLNVIRGADVVWLQVNSMAHSYYNRIIDTVRTNGVPVRYFGSSSPKRCAMQLALDEMETEKKQLEP